jgi:hypothetical protein
MKNTFTPTQAAAIATEIGLHFADHRFDVEQFRMGLEVELEHGDEDARLADMEAEAKEYGNNQPTA